MREITTLLHDLRTLLEPSTEIDAEIWGHFESDLRDELKTIPADAPIPPFTNSIDFACLLIPNECWWAVNSQCSGALGFHGHGALIVLTEAGNCAIALAALGVQFRELRKQALSKAAAAAVKH